MAPPVEVQYDGYVYETDDPVFASSIETGQSDPYPADLEIVRRYLTMFPHKNRTCIDIGAQIGTTLMPYSKMFQRLVGFDPNPHNFKFLETNIAKNGLQERTTLRNCGIYSVQARGSIRRHGDNSASYHFVPSFLGDKDNATNEAEIRCHTLDNECRDLGVLDSVDFLKIDTAGCELFCLQGAETVLRASKPLVQIEYNGLSDALYGISLGDIMDFMKYMGYLPFSLDRSRSNNIFFYCPHESLAIQPRYLFCLWFGEGLSTDRRECLEDIQNTTGACVKFLMNEECKKFMIPAFPFHEALPYLSDTHKSDYLRTYLMHFIGGGYTDMKKQTGDWRASFDRIEDDPTVLGVGYPEIDANGVAYPPVKAFFRQLVGNGAYIFRPNTVFTECWFHRLTEVLDSKIEELRRHPARFAQDDKKWGGGYPMEWNEILGRIFHRLNHVWHPRIVQILPPPVFFSCWGVKVPSAQNTPLIR